MKKYKLILSEEERIALQVSLDRVTTTGIKEASSLVHLVRLIELAPEYIDTPEVPTPTDSEGKAE